MDLSVVCVADFEQLASERLAKPIFEFCRDGANNGVTAKDNKEAFQRWKIMPRVLRNTNHLDLSTTILGHQVSFPVCVAPVGLQGLIHPEGEIASAKGAEAGKTLFSLSMLSTKTIEEVAQATPALIKFAQVYPFRDRKVTLNYVRCAEQSGYHAIILTVDCAVSGKKVNVLRNRFNVLRDGCGNLPHKKEGFDSEKEYMGVVSQFDAELKWDDVLWLSSLTNLPIILKGILTAADAKLAVQVGVAGIIVSNHGGRQLDTTPASIDVLPEVVRAVEGRCEVYLDGGVRLGTDVFKALALGARAVFVGRPTIFALACNGAEGVAKMLQILREELASTMALSGSSNIKDIHREMIRHQSSFHAKI